MYEIYRSGESKAVGGTTGEAAGELETMTSNITPSPTTTQPPASATRKSVIVRSVDDYSETMRRERPTHHLFAAYAPKPMRTSFESQAETERVLFLLRQHPIVLLKPLLILLAGLIFPAILNLTPFLDFLPDKFQLGFLLAWHVVLIGFALQTFLVWFFNVYIVTDERIIDVDFLSIVYKNVSSAKIDNIEDVTVNTSGAAESIFDYGSVLIQTAAEKNQFEFENIPHPTRVAAIINDIMLEEEREKLEGRVS